MSPLGDNPKVPKHSHANLNEGGKLGISALLANNIALTDGAPTPQTFQQSQNFPLGVFIQTQLVLEQDSLFTEQWNNHTLTHDGSLLSTDRTQSWADAGGTILTSEFAVIENRTSDPAGPATGRIWLRTDL